MIGRLIYKADVCACVHMLVRKSRGYDMEGIRRTSTGFCLGSFSLDRLVACFTVSETVLLSKSSMSCTQQGDEINGVSKVRGFSV